MMKHILFLVAYLFSSIIFAQYISGKIVDAKTNEAIPFAAVQSDENIGVISNEEGYFTISSTANNALTISCLGYQKTTINIEKIRSNNGIIVLKEAVNELNEVFITNKYPSADSIIARVIKYDSLNYNNNLVNHNYFLRFSNFSNFKKADFDLSKTSGFKKKQLKEVNKSFDSLSNIIKQNKSVYYYDTKGSMFINKFSKVSKDSLKPIQLKLTNAKNVQLLDKTKNFLVENIQEKSQALILKYLDTTKTYKLKSGLFKIDDSLSLKKMLVEVKDTAKTVKIKALKNNFYQEFLANNINKYSFLNQVSNNKKKLKTYYEYTLENVTYFNDDLVYIIGFRPAKPKAKFSGKLFVSESDYAIQKIEYQYAKGKRGEHINLRLLFGVKYSKNIKSGVIIFKKTGAYYYPYYTKNLEQSYFYVNRPIKFIENSENKNKTTFNFKMEGVITDKSELLISETNTITEEEFNTINEKETVPKIILKNYDATVWKNENVLEPTEDMKRFNGQE